MTQKADPGNASPRTTVGKALLQVLSKPFYYFIQHWNWKSALFGAINRGTIFFIATMKRGHVEMSIAVLVEIAFTCATAGIYAAFTQAMRFAEPEWLAAGVVALVIPGALYGVDYFAHVWTGMHNVRPAVGFATGLSVVSTLFNLFIMRRGALVVGEGSQPLWRDLIRIPGLIVQFLVAGPVWLWNLLFRRRGKARTGTVVVLALIALPVIAAAQTASANGSTPLTTDQVVNQLVQQNARRAALLTHYENCRFYSVDYVGFPSQKSAEMVVDMAYDAPAQKQFRVVKEQGSKLLLDHVLRELIQTEKEALDKSNLGRTDLTPNNYEFHLVGTDTIAGQPQYVLEVTPRFKSKFLYNGKIWVDASDFAVSRVAAEPAKNISFWISHTEIEHEYKKHGEFWLPAQNTSTTHVRFGGTATLKIDYRDYRIGQPKPGSTADVCSQAASQMQLRKSSEESN
jgi:hypothetical protein